MLLELLVPRLQLVAAPVLGVAKLPKAEDARKQAGHPDAKSSIAEPRQVKLNHEEQLTFLT